MRIENGSLGAALCVTLACFGAACSSSSDSQTPNSALAGSTGGAGAPALNAGAGGSLAAAGASGGQSAGGAPNGGGAAGASLGGTSSAGGANAGAANGGAGGTPATSTKQRTVGYLPSYRGQLTSWASSADLTMLNYVDLCFAGVDAAGNISYMQPDVATFASAAHTHGVKVCMAFGGATTINDLGTLAGNISPANRAAFIDKITSYAVTNNLDCIDIDFEGNGVNQDYEGFVTALAPALHAKGKEMSAAMASWFGDKITLPAIQAFDFVNVMAYDLHNPGGNATPVQSSSIADSTAEIDYWVGRGLAKEKAVLGVPFYGYSWKAGSTSGEAVLYSALLSTYGTDVLQNDSIMKDGVTIYLNSQATIEAKTKLARQYGGIMAWELGQDASGQSSLLRAIYSTP